MTRTLRPKHNAIKCNLLMNLTIVLTSNVIYECSPVLAVRVHVSRRSYDDQSESRARSYDAQVPKAFNETVVTKQQRIQRSTLSH